MENFTIKAEPGAREENERGLPYAEIYIDLPDVKKECIEHSESVTEATGKIVFFIFR